MNSGIIIYWANSIFSQADRDFNANCVKAIRETGFEVYSPQEKAFNQSNGEAVPSNIFNEDTEMIFRCDIFIACIDQESIDSGVACELGIAWARGKKLLGLYTDFRRNRIGEFRMYKNPYVIGCIQDRGKIVSSIEEIKKELIGYYGEQHI